MDIDFLTMSNSLVPSTDFLLVGAARDHPQRMETKDNQFYFHHLRSTNPVPCENAFGQLQLTKVRPMRAGFGGNFGPSGGRGPDINPSEDEDVSHAEDVLFRGVSNERNLLKTFLVPNCSCFESHLLRLQEAKEV